MTSDDILPEDQHGRETGASSNADGTTPSRSVNPALLSLLVCPVTKTDLIYQASLQELWSRPAGLAYPIREGIPIMLPDEARTLTDEEKKP